jgi:hypothetical protein
MSYRRALKKVARSTQRRPPTPHMTVKGWTGTITSTSGTTVDSRPQVTVDVNGSIFPAPYLITTGWTPASGQTVFVMFMNGSPLILGRIGGFPSY